MTAPISFWGVPDYVPEAAVRSIADLAKPDVAAQMTKTIQGIGAGATISVFLAASGDGVWVGSDGLPISHGYSLTVDWRVSKRSRTDAGWCFRHGSLISQSGIYPAFIG